MLRIAPAIIIVSLAAFYAAPEVHGQDLSSLAAGVLSQTKQARETVRNRDQQAALGHVREAEALAAQIQTAKAGQPLPWLVPVNRQVETTSTYTDVKHKHGEMSADRLKKDSHISEVEQRTSADELNVTTAIDSLSAAESALERQDWAEVDTDLAAVTNLVRTDASTESVPLLQAHQNLMLARARIAEGNYKAAVAPLREAGHALADFEQQGLGVLRQQAETMRQDIDAYARHLRGASLDQIDEWIKTIEHWQEQTKHPLQPPNSW